MTSRTVPSARAGMAERALLGVAQRGRGVQTVRRPATGDTPTFDLTYVRAGVPSPYPPVVVIPGGPGLGSVLPYRTVRALAARHGIDLIMIEHRGVGLSRRDTAGDDLPRAAMRVNDVMDDICAVLDHEGIARACIVGSSYGSYLAMNFGATHPERVASMLLDSALVSAEHLELERAAVRALLWDRPGAVAEAMHRLAATDMPDRVLLDVARAAYELGGDTLLLPLLQHQLRRGHSAVWAALAATATRDASLARVPGVYEFDLVGTIGFRELGYGGVADGHPIDPALTYAPLVDQFPPFAGEPRSLSSALASFDWPLVVLSGTRDLRTPPSIAHSVAATAPDATLVTIENGHSALETHPLALVNALAWLLAGRHHELPSIAARLDRLPRRGIAAKFPNLISAGLKLGL